MMIINNKNSFNFKKYPERFTLTIENEEIICSKVKTNEGVLELHELSPISTGYENLYATSLAKPLEIKVVDKTSRVEYFYACMLTKLVTDYSEGCLSYSLSVNVLWEDATPLSFFV